MIGRTSATQWVEEWKQFYPDYIQHPEMIRFECPRNPFSRIISFVISLFFSLFNSFPTAREQRAYASLCTFSPIWKTNEKINTHLNFIMTKGLCTYTRTQWTRCIHSLAHTHKHNGRIFGLFTEMQNKTLDKQINAEEQKRNRKQ